MPEALPHHETNPPACQTTAASPGQHIVICSAAVSLVVERRAAAVCELASQPSEIQMCLCDWEWAENTQRQKDREVFLHTWSNERNLDVCHIKLWGKCECDGAHMYLAAGLKLLG